MTTYRSEVKYICSQRELGAITAWIHKAPVNFSRHYPDRYVNNIYFDTPQSSDASDNLIGLSQRQKLRLRWYHRQSTADVYLELKIANNHQGTKRALDLGVVDLENTTVRSLASSIRNRTQEPCFRDNIRLSQPVVQNCYKRRYLISSDETFRVTIDVDQAFTVKYQSDALLMTRMRSTFPYVVVEFKSDLLRADSTRILSGFPLTTSRNSKYLTGLSRLAGLPYF